VVANTVLFNPSNRSALFAYDAVDINDAVAAVPNNDPVNEEADTDPNIDKLPVKDVLPDTISDPVIVWLPLNVFDPVVANIVLFNPSNRSALFAYDAVPNNEPVNDADTGPIAVRDPVTITLPVNSNVSAFIKKSLADDAVVA
jgi:hypothetical protein